MEVILLRHGQTPGNACHRYVGSTDEPLSEQGRLQACESGVCPDADYVFVSPLLRARQTASICFPNAQQRVVEGLREMDFGVFEGRSASEMEHDAAYRAWVDGGCLDRCPKGEDRDSFSDRTAKAFLQVLEKEHASGVQRVVFVAHGGTVMAVMDFLGAEGGYFSWHVGNCGGVFLELAFAEGGGSAFGIELKKASSFSALQEVLL